MSGQRGRTIWPLQSLNFFMADMQAGIGPFLGRVPARARLAERADRHGDDHRRRRRHDHDRAGRSAVDATTRKRALCHRSRRLHRARLVHHSAVAGFLARRRVAGRHRDRRAPRSARRSTASRLASSGRPASTGRTAATRPSITPATWSAPACPASSAGSSAWPPCSGWRPLFGVLSIISVLMIPRDAIDDSVARGLNEDGANDGQGERLPGPARLQAAADPRRGAGLLPPRQRRHAAALRPGGRGGQAGRSRQLRRDHDRGRAGVMIVASLLAMRMAEKRGLLAGPADLVPGAADPRPRRRPLDHITGASIPSRFSTASARDCKASPFPASSRAS